MAAAVIAIVVGTGCSSGDDSGSEPTVTTAPADAACEAAFVKAETIGYDSDDYDATYLATADACTSDVGFLVELRRHPAAAGLRPDAPDSAFAREVDIVCAKKPAARMCADR